MKKKPVKRVSKSVVALTVAGSDSGGGAGIQTDLKTFHTFGVFGTTAITCVTAQNPDQVSDVQALSPAIVAGQIDRVFEVFNVRATKIGMLYDTPVILTVCDALRRHRVARLVVDPVMVATSGAMLLKRDAVEMLRSALFPIATVVTPNVAEAEALWGHPIRGLDGVREAARALATRHGVPFLVKGGHLEGASECVDVLHDGRASREFGSPVVRRIEPHGAGCAFSAAITAHLALGHDLVASIRKAKRFIGRALRTALRLGRYRALNV